MAVTPTILDATYSDSGTVLSGGGLVVTLNPASYATDPRSVFAATAGKHYFEVTLPARAGATEQGIYPGVLVSDSTAYDKAYTYSPYSSGGTIGVYMDLGSGGTTSYLGYITPTGADTGTRTFTRNIAWPVKANAILSVTTDATPPGGWVATFNFGASPFVHTPPAGYAYGFGESVPDTIIANLTCPSPQIQAGAISFANVSPPSPIMTAFSGGVIRLEVTAGTIFSTGHSSAGENSIYGFPAGPKLSAFGGVNAALTDPKQALSITGTFTVAGTAALAAPTPTLSATGKVSAVAGAALTAPTAKLVGYFGSVATVSVTGSPTLTASGTTGAVGRAALTAPLFELTATATRQNSGSAILTAPVGRLATTGAAWLIAPGAQLTAIGTAVVAVSYEAYALNLKHNPTPGVEPVDELTRYTNYPFDRIVRYKNSYFGMNNTGLYLLEGTTDFATPTPTEVPWSYKTALMDMKSVQLKNVSMAYFGGRMGPAATVSVYVGEASVAPYNYTTPRDATAQNYRQPLGKGLKSRYYAFGASGTGELTLDTLSLDVAVLARKV